MNVSDIIAAVSEFSVGAGNVTDADKANFLQYLNFYKDYLYSKTCLIDRSLVKKATYSALAYDADYGVLLPGDILDVTKVFVSSSTGSTDRSELRLISVDDSATTITETGASEYYTISKEPPSWYMYLWPIPSAAIDLFVFYVNNPVAFTINTLSEDIPFPAVYHQLLVDGTLWYVFQEMAGFKDSTKAQEAKLRVREREQHLFAFLSNSNMEQSSAVAGLI